MKKQFLIPGIILGSCLIVFGIFAALFSLIGLPKASEANSLYLGIYLGLGESAMESKQYQLAERIFQAALSLAKASANSQTDEAESHTRIAQCLRRQNKKTAALIHFAKAKELYEGSADLFMFSMDKRIQLRCLKEYRLTLQEFGKKKEAAALCAKIDELSEELGPVERVRQQVSEL